MFGVFVNFRTVVINPRHIGRLFSLNGYLLKSGGLGGTRIHNQLIKSQLLYH